MSEITVVAGSSSAELASHLARRMGARLVTGSVRTFPDGESKITLAGALAGHCVVVQSTHPPVDTNLVHALSLVRKAADATDAVTAVIPYMGYARQDREFLPGEITTLKMVGAALAGVGAKNVVTVDIHSMTGLEQFGGRARNVSAVPELAGYFGRLDLNDPVAVSPDQGGRDRVAAFAKVLGSDHTSLTKFRDKRTGAVSLLSQDADVVGRDIILVDDMISTGGSMVEAARFLVTRGCGRVFAACTHAVLADNAAEKIRLAGVSGIVSANTIPGNTAVVDVSGVVAGTL